VLGRPAPRPGARPRPVFVDAAPDSRRGAPVAPPPQLPAPTAPPPVSVVDFPEKVVFTNAGGSWHIWKQLTWSPEGDRVVGPGYIGLLERPWGTVVVDDFREPGPLNDPRYGGLGAFGWQHARLGQGMWDLHGRLDAATSGGFGVARSAVPRGPAIGTDGAGELEVRVEFRDGWTDPIMAATYTYRFEEAAVTCSIRVEQLWPGDRAGQAFVKEPKIVASVTVPEGAVEVLGHDGSILQTIELAALPDPWDGTAQIGDPARWAVRFLDGNRLDVAVDGADFDRWAVLAETRARLSGAGAGYCLDGGALKRRWEVAKRKGDPQTSCMFHAWQGGSGYPDCETASRAFGPYGEGFTIAARYA